MKKILLSLLAISGLFLLSGCSLTGTTVDNNSVLLEQISLLQQQMSGLNSEIQGLKEQNETLVEENDIIKNSLSGQNNGTYILVAQNEELKKNIEKYKKIIIEYKLNNNKDNNNINTTTITNNTTSIITTNQGYITEAYTDGGKNYIKIDYTEDGQMGPSGAPDIINNNPLIRTFEVSNNAIFNILKYNSNGGQEPQNIARNEFEIRSNGDFTTLNPDPMNPSYYGAGKTSLVEIKHDTKIYEITEIYRP